MSATTYGAINFSLSNETGLYTETVSQDISNQVREIPSAGGEIVAGAFYGNKGTFSMDGALKTSESPTWSLAAAVTLVNESDLSGIVPGYTSGATYVITGASVALGAEMEERRTISGNIYPFLEAVS